MSVMGTHFIISNAIELWQKENCHPSIPTFSQALDSVLGSSGLSLNAFLELLGLPGTGKTQLCLQLCASIQIPKCLGGLNAEALYVDTNTNFTAVRFAEILSASILRCQQLLDLPLDFREEDALRKLHYVNAFDFERFCAFMHSIGKFITEHPRVKLIVIDSIAFPFKEGVEARRRTGLLFRLMANLQRVAKAKQIAVVLTNEMSTRVGLSGSAGAAVGALGDAWAHRCTSRLLLLRTQGAHAAMLLKTNDADASVARFQITQEGIRDVE